MNTFKKIRLKNREKFTQLMEAMGIEDYTFSEENNEWFAMFINKEDQAYIVDVTDRKKKHDEYSSWIIEKKDYDKLRSFAKKQDVSDVLSINFFQNNYFSIWSMNSIDYPDVRKSQFKKTTVFNDDPVNKLVVYMKNKEATTGRINTRNNSIKYLTMKNE